MGKNLVIVESPSKSKTIEKYLGDNYKVLSSKGHVRDLSTKGKYGFGVDVDNEFQPDYVILKGKKKDVNELKREAKNADHVYLATDLDREGEAISWHLYDVLGLDDKKYDRIVFNEITKPAILESLEHPRKIDYDLVNSQETRRIIDRIIGFRLSKLIKSKTDGGTSAGRVQSVALKLIVDREREIEAFVPTEYYTIKAIFDDFESELYGYDNKEISIDNEESANDILSKLSDSFKVSSVTEKVKKKSSKFPFTTSTLQQEASTKLGMGAKKTMSIAQKLYEGIELEDGPVGLISYMRTDSVRFSLEFVRDTFSYIENNYGKDYVGYVKKSNKTENVQDAHEAIRPTSIYRTPLSVKNFLSNDEYKLYRLIYFRALASLMADSKSNNTSVVLDNNNYQFKLNGHVLLFDGYLSVYSDYEDSNDVVLRQFLENEIIVSKNIESEQHFTKPPSRYSEAKLIKEMEELGIGRPSTYAKIVDTLKLRKYVSVLDKRFVPTDIGIQITDKLGQCFSNIINVEYTANMENDLDLIAEGHENYINTLKNFYNEFEPTVEKAMESLPKKEVKKTGELCPMCGGELVFRKGRYGEFIACGNFPNCRYVYTEKREDEVVCDCSCGGKIILKKSKRGKVFYGCNNYPKCKNAYWDKPTGDICPKCSNMLVTRDDTIKCSSCDYVK